MAACLTAASSHNAGAQTYPSRPVRFIAPGAPGGSADIYSRIVGAKLSEKLGVQFVVDDRPGAGGALGAELAAKAPPDGYTIWLGQTNNLAIGPAMRPKNSYDPIRDFAPITLLMQAPQVMVVSVSSPITSIKDLIAAAKASPDKFTFGSAGIGSTGHVNGELFNSTAGIRITHVPYKGGTPALLDLMGGRITYISTSLASAAQMMKEGKVRALATTGTKRARMLPEVPTVAESGLAGYEVVSWHGILAPAKTPHAIVAKLNREIVSILDNPDVRQLLLSEGGEISPGTPDEFAAFLRAEVSKWRKVVQQAGITAE